jgi:hypothetical protein
MEFQSYLLRNALLLKYLNKYCVRFEVITALTMKNAVIWDINTQFVPYR